MGSIRKHPAVKLIVGFIYNDNRMYLKAKQTLLRAFGPVDFESQPITFTQTSYYQKEFGSGLLRRFISFKKLIPPHRLAEIKLKTNSLEQRLGRKGSRRINIDPGYVDMAKLVLATTKDFKHRIYLDKGIFAEITLYYQDRSFRSWEWTYPDYCTEEYIKIFNGIRHVYAQQI